MATLITPSPLQTLFKHSLRLSEIRLITSGSPKTGFFQYIFSVYMPPKFVLHFCQAFYIYTKMKDFAAARVATLVLLSGIVSLAWITPCQSISCHPPPSPKPKCPPPPPSPPEPEPKCPPTPTPEAKCPRDTLKFGICTSWLGLVSGVLGAKPSPKCCALLQGISELEAAICLCTALKANVLGVVHIELPIAISFMLSGCKQKIPEGFKC